MNITAPFAPLRVSNSLFRLFRFMWEEILGGDTVTTRYLELTAQIVAAQVENNPIPVRDLPRLIQVVFRALATIDVDTAPVGKPEPAVAIKRSVFPDYIICLEDGKKLKVLKRHLQASFNMTPMQYRQRWGLPDDYPMVAPAYAKRRSAFAIISGLGLNRSTRTRAAASTVLTTAPAKRVWPKRGACKELTIINQC